MSRGAESLTNLYNQAKPIISNLLLAAQAYKDKKPYAAANHALNGAQQLPQLFESIASIANWSAPYLGVAQATVKRAIHLASTYELTGYWIEKGYEDKGAEVMVVHEMEFGLISLYVPAAGDDAVATGLGFKKGNLTEFWLHDETNTVQYSGFGYDKEMFFTYVKRGSFSGLHSFKRK